MDSETLKNYVHVNLTSFKNFTNSAQRYVGGGLSAQITTAVVSCVGIILNAFVLVILFLSRKTNKSTLVPYVVTLIFLDLIYELIRATTTIAEMLHWTPHSSCSLGVYHIYSVTGMQIHSHALLTINRLWAIIAPVHYRNHMQKKTIPYSFIFGMITYVHLFTLPGIIMDELYYRPYYANPCTLQIKDQLLWARVTEVCIFAAPIVFVVASYVVIAWKMYSRIRTTVTPIPSDGNEHGGIGRLRHRFVKRINAKLGRGHAFLLITTMTAAVIVFLAPSIFYYTASMFGYRKSSFTLSVASALFVCAPVVDPLVFLFSFKELRQATLKLFSR